LFETPEPASVLQEDVEVEQVVVADRGATGAGLPQLVGEAPHLQGSPDRGEQVDDAVGGRLHRPLAALRAAEGIGTRLEVDTHPHHDLIG